MRSTFLIVLLVVLADGVYSQGVPIGPVIMGQNYHFAKWTNPATGQLNIFGDQLTYSAVGNNTVMANGVRSSNCELLRIGGNQYNISDHKPNAGQEVYYVSLIDEARKNGMEPVLTLPFLLDIYKKSVEEHVEPAYTHSLYAQAVQEAIDNLKTILHLVNTVHKRNLKYVVLGNEPDLDYMWTTDVQDHFGACSFSNTPNACTTTPAYTIALNIANYIKPMADAVKAFDPSIKIIGPEYTHCLPRVYNYLFTPSNTATYIGGISTVTSLGSPSVVTNQPYLDYISFHFYGPDYNVSTFTSTNSYIPPYSGSTWPPEASYCNLERYYKMEYESSNSARRYRGALRYMTDLITRCQNTRNSQQLLGFMITEMNSGHKNETDPTPSASTAAGGVDAISMQGAQNLARMYALAMEYGAASVMQWSIMESGQNQDRGYLVGQGNTAPPKGSRRPSWFHYKMLADYFKGIYYRDEVFAGYTAGGSS